MERKLQSLGEYKYLGSVIKTKLDWSPNTLAARRRRASSGYLKRIKPFDVCPKLLELFYRFTVESVVTLNSLISAASNTGLFI